MVNDKLKFFVENLLDGAGVSLASNVTNQLPLANLQHESKRKVWRGTGTSATITIDLGAAEQIDSLFLIRENLTESATIEWRYSSDNFVGEDVQAGILTVGEKPSDYDLVFPLLLDAAISRRYWRCILSDGSNPDGFLTVGRLFLGLRTEYTAGLLYPWVITLVDQSQVERSAAGDPLRHRRAKWRKVTFDMAALTDEDEAHQEFMDFIMDVGLSRDFFISLSPADEEEVIQRRHTLYGSFTQIDGLTEESTRVYVTKQIVFEES